MNPDQVQGVMERLMILASICRDLARARCQEECAEAIASNDLTTENLVEWSHLQQKRIRLEADVNLWLPF